jgi:haloalkane dehalogenase
MTAWMEQVDLRHATFFGQDWGALIGLRLVAENPDRFDRVVIGNGGLPTGDGKPGEAFLRWQKFSQESPAFDVGRVINGGTTTELSDEVIAAYDAPFPDNSYKAGARIFPSLVPTSPDDPAAPANKKAWETLLKWDKPFLTAFSDSDPITKGGERAFQGRVPGCEGQPHVTIEGAGHFLQEDKGEELGKIVVDFIARTS